jgi:hypothetical protein
VGADVTAVRRTARTWRFLVHGGGRARCLASLGVALAEAGRRRAAGATDAVRLLLPVAEDWDPLLCSELRAAGAAVLLRASLPHVGGTAPDSGGVDRVDFDGLHLLACDPVDVAAWRLALLRGLGDEGQLHSTTTVSSGASLDRQGLARSARRTASGRSSPSTASRAGQRHASG